MAVGWLIRGMPLLLKCNTRRTGLTLQSRFLHSDVSWHQRVGVAFDIDGVLLRGKTPIEGASAALKQLHGGGSEHQAGQFSIPYVFLTNGGGVTEAAKAEELSTLLDVPVTADQVILGHTPFKRYAERYCDQRVLTIGKGDTRSVMEAYGFRSAISVDEYVHEFPDIDPLHQPGPSACQTDGHDEPLSLPDNQRVAAVFVVSDSLNWGRDIQVVCDVLRSGGLPGDQSDPVKQIPLFFAADDFEYQAKFPVSRFGMGAFRIALESVYKKLMHTSLSYVAYGKPRPEPYSFALRALQEQYRKAAQAQSSSEPFEFERVYMIGDNPNSDIHGALNIGRPWQPILVRTGVYQGAQPLYKAPGHVHVRGDISTPVVPSVAEAIDYILKGTVVPVP